jgi:ABC-type uncharacterized transport system ATPase subunit
MSEGEKEDTLMNVIANTLEEYGYLPRLRGGLKVTSFRKGQELVERGEIPSCDSLRKVELSADEQLLVGLCVDLFGACGLVHTKEMILLETNFQGLDVRKEFPEYSGNQNVAVLSQIVKSIRNKLE